MFSFLGNRGLNKALLMGVIAFNSLNAQASLTSYHSNGVDLVYSSASHVTWTKDANLLGSMIASQGYSTVINAIIAASPTISSTPSNFDGYTGTYNITAANFVKDDQGLGLPLGLTNWFGAMAFVNYLNSINYGGSNQWRLPTTRISSGSDAAAAQNGASTGEEYAELYYSELGRTYNQSSAGPNSVFDNEQERAYWTGSQSLINADGALASSMNNGTQGLNYKGFVYYAWAVSPGQITAVPEPENLIMLLAGLGFIAYAIRQRRI